MDPLTQESNLNLVFSPKEKQKTNVNEEQRELDTRNKIEFVPFHTHDTKDAPPIHWSNIVTKVIYTDTVANLNIILGRYASAKDGLVLSSFVSGTAEYRLHVRINKVWKSVLLT